MLTGVFVKCSGLPGNIVRAGPKNHLAEGRALWGGWVFPKRDYSFPRTLLDDHGGAEMTGGSKWGARRECGS